MENTKKSNLSISELIDLHKFWPLMDNFCKSIGIASAIIDLEGNIMTRSNWQTICTDFYRQNPETCKRCIESDTFLAESMRSGERYAIYTCRNGLTDAVSPIVIQGKHIANLFVGQFLLEPPDVDRFKNQAARFGFDIAAYMEALSRVPVVPEEKVQAILSSLVGFAELLGDMGMQSIRQREITEMLRESESRFRGIAGNIPGVVYQMRVRKDGSTYFSYVSPRAGEIFDLPADLNSPNWNLGTRVHPDDREAFLDSIKQVIRDRADWNFEGRMVMLDGTVKWFQGISSPTQIDDELVFDGLLLDTTGRKQAEEKLLRLNAAVEQATDAWVITDIQGQITYANPAIERLYGYAPQELIGKHPSSLNSDSVDEYGILQGLMEKGSWSGEVEQRRKDGSTFPALLSVFIVRDERGTADSTVTSVRDITEQKRAEEALRESEKRYRAVVEDQVEMICRFAPDGTLTFANKAFCRHWNRSEEELIGQKFWGLIPDEGRRQVSGQLGLISPENPVATQEHRVTANNGETLWERWTDRGIFDEEGCVVEYQAVGIDITEQKRAEEALRESEERLGLVLKGADLGMWDWNIQTGEVIFNERWAEMLGYTLDEIRPHVGSWEKLLHPDDVAGVMEVLNKHLEGQTPFYEVEHRLLTKSGDWKCVLAQGRVFARDEDGKPLRAAGIHMDITDRLRLEEQLRQSQKLEAVGILAGGVAHNFNNLLTAILGNINLAMLEVKPGSQAEKDLKSAERSIRRAADLTTQLLAIGRKSQVEAPRVPIKLNPACEEVATLLRRTIDRRIRVVTCTADDLWPVVANYGQMNQVLMNLCINAHDALLDRLEGTCKPAQPGETPTITIKTANVTIDESYSRLNVEAKQGEFVRLIVSDNGCGMGAETMERAFEPFFTTKEVNRGTGLGLAMVRSIVGGYNGWVTLYSEPGIGTTVNVYLPRSGGAAAPEEEVKTVALPPTGSETILLVDDEEEVIEVGRRILEMQGYRVHLARDGQEALEIYKREREHIDLALLDLTMPKLSGQEVISEILRLDPKAKIVLTSGHSANGPGRTAMDGGAIAFVQKPFDFGELVQAVRAALDVDL